MAPGDRREKRAGKLRLQAAIQAVEDEANDLRKLISFPLVNLQDSSDFEPIIGQEAVRGAFEKEIRFIGDEIQRAKQGIEDYFFTPTNTVNLKALKGENMLVSLDRVHKMCKALRKQLH